VVIACEKGSQRFVAHGCAVARRAGVRRGMTLAHAMALLPADGVHIALHDPAGDARSLARLARWALRWSPAVSVDGADGLLIDTTGCERVFGGEESLLRLLHAGLRGFGLECRIGVAGTIGAAWALARFGGRRVSRVKNGEERAALASFPVRALRLDSETVEALAEVGVARVGELIELPRSALPARFGLTLLSAIDRALGEEWESVRPIVDVPPPSVSLDLPGGTTHRESIEAAARGLIGELCGMLRSLERGATRLHLIALRLGLPPGTIAITLSRPSRSARHLWSLLEPKIQSLHVGFGLERMELVAVASERVPHRQEQFDRIGDSASGDASRAAGELVDALSARFGPDGVRGMQFVDTHLPERASRLVTLAEREVATPVAGNITPARPSLLLDPPEPARIVALTPDGPVMRFSWRGISTEAITSIGPERLAPEWWRSRECGNDRVPDDERDYFRVQDAAGRWLWLFRTGSCASWFVHGVWA